MQFLRLNTNRTGTIKKNIIAMFLIKLGNIAINLAYVPVLINTLDQDRYGVWLTITSIITWISYFDIGLGNGLRNKLAEAIATNREDDARMYVSTTYVSMGAVCLIFLLISMFIIPCLNWTKILNTNIINEQELTILMLWVVSCVIIQMLLKLINSILYALQKPAFSSFLLTLSQFFAFICVWVYSRFVENVSLLYLGTLISTIPIIVLFFSSLLLFYFSPIKKIKPNIRYFDKTKVRTITSLGGRFFWIQLTALVLFQSNSLIIAHVCGSASVVEYNIAYKYIGLIEMISFIIMTPIWSATTDAFSRKDFDWIKNTIMRLKKISYSLVFCGLILVFFSPYAYKLWLGNSLEPNYLLLLLLLLYFAIQLLWQCYGNIINGIGYIKLQFYFTVVEAFIHIPMAIFLGSIYGLYGVVSSLIISTIFNAIWPRIQINKILKGENGIWTK